MTERDGRALVLVDAPTACGSARCSRRAEMEQTLIAVGERGVEEAGVRGRTWIAAVTAPVTARLTG